MVEISIPVVHSFASALRRYRALGRGVRIGFALLLIGPVVSYVFHVSWPAWLGGVLAFGLFMNYWKNEAHTRHFIIDSWLGGSEARFEEIRHDLGAFIRRLPHEAETSVKNRGRENRNIKFNLLASYLVVMLGILAVCAIVDFVFSRR